MFTKLLVPLDGSALAEQALGPAASIARATGGSLELLLVHQLLAFADMVDAVWQTNAADSERAYLASTARELSQGATVGVSSAVVSGEAVEAICAHVKAVNADAVVMTSHGRTGLSRVWLGSVANAVIRQSRVPVLLLRPADPARRRASREPLVKRLLVTLDGSSLSEAILAPAFDLARAFDARLILLRVVEPVPMVVPEVVLPVRNLPRDEDATADVVAQATAQLDAIAKRALELGVGRVDARVIVADRVAKAILDFARGVNPSVIAMSTHGRGASRFLLGSVTDKVLRGTTRPMLVCRPDAIGGESPLLDDAGVAAQLPALSGV